MDKKDRDIYRLVDAKLVKIGTEKTSYNPNKNYALVCESEREYLSELTATEEAKRLEMEKEWKAEEPIRKAEELEQQKLTEKFKNTLSYENRLVCFIDILGWSTAIMESVNDINKIQNLGFTVDAFKKITEIMRQQKDFLPDDFSLEMTHFSDCILFSTSADSFGKSRFLSTLSLLTTSLLYKGFLFRGGITSGLLYHRDSLVFGPALLKAYELESKCALYPRIILDYELAKYWGQGDNYLNKDGSLIGQSRTWRMSYDGFRFYDFLQPFDGSPDFWNNPELIQAQLNPVRKIIVEALKKYERNQKIFPKYAWLANYFNEVCVEHSGHSVELIKIEKISV